MEVDHLLRAVAGTIVLDHAEHHPSQRGSSESSCSTSRSSTDPDISDKSTSVTRQGSRSAKAVNIVWTEEDLARAKARARKFQKYRAAMTPLLASTSFAVKTHTQQLVRMCQHTIDFLSVCNKQTPLCTSLLQFVRDDAPISFSRPDSICSTVSINSDPGSEVDSLQHCT